MRSGGSGFFAVVDWEVGGICSRAVGAQIGEHANGAKGLVRYIVITLYTVSETALS